MDATTLHTILWYALVQLFVRREVVTRWGWLEGPVNLLILCFWLAYLLGGFR